MSNRFFIVLICIILFLSCESDSSDLNQNDDLVESEILWEDYVIFKTGNIPLLIIAPHGGNLKPQWLEDRSCPDSKLLQDQYTLEIALQIEKELNAIGYKPYMVLSKMHRIKIDLNRSINTAGHPTSPSTPTPASGELRAAHRAVHHRPPSHHPVQHAQTPSQSRAAGSPAIAAAE